MSIRPGRRAGSLLISGASLLCAAMPVAATAQDAITLLGQERVISALAITPVGEQASERISPDTGPFSDTVTAAASGFFCLTSPFGAGDTTAGALTDGDITPQACVRVEASASASQDSLITIRNGGLEIRARGTAGGQALGGTATAKSKLTATFAVDGLVPFVLQGEGLAGSAVLTSENGTVFDIHPLPSDIAQPGVLPAGTYTLVMEAVQAIGAFTLRFSAGVMPQPSGPRCTVRMTRPTYGPGDVVTASQLRIENPLADPVSVELKVWLRLPDGGLMPAKNDGADGSVVVQGGTSQDFGPLDVMGVTADTASGLWELGCRLVDPVSGRQLYENNDLFDIQ